MEVFSLTLQTLGWREARHFERFSVEILVSLARPSETRRDEAIFSLLENDDL